MSFKRNISAIESRFKEVSGTEGVINTYPLSPEKASLVEDNEGKPSEFGEVFTPLWLVDEVIEKVSGRRLRGNRTTLDMCAGYGQFTLRLLRKKESLLGEDFDPNVFLYSSPHNTATHHLSELQFSSVYKLLYIFGCSKQRYVNLFIGDSTFLYRTPKECNGIWIYTEDEEWVDFTSDVLGLFGQPDSYSIKEEKKFCIILNALLKKRSKEQGSNVLNF